MRLLPLPGAASWTHQGVRSGFEVAFFARETGGYRLRGHTTATEASASWSVGYDVLVDDSWVTQEVRATRIADAGGSEVIVRRSGAGAWTVDGAPRPDLDGCVDIDLESSAMTNTLPVHRLDLAIGVSVDVPAAFIRAGDRQVERLEQRYTLRSVGSGGPVIHYESSTFDFECELRLDAAGLVVSYPGIALRHS